MKVKLLKKLRKKFTISYYPREMIFEVKIPRNCFYPEGVIKLLTLEYSIELRRKVLLSYMEEVYGKSRRRKRVLIK